VETVTDVLLLPLAAALSGWMVRLSPVPLPLPIVQIGLGALVAYGSGLSIALEPEVFFLVFLPPLLFVDGWRISKRDFFRDFGTILTLAIGLVLFTILGIGFFIHWLISGMPLAIAFALAAVLSPTDPIAVSSLAASAPIPRRLMHILEGEALLNDASGLVCLRFAIAAALTGTFSLQQAFLTFLQLALVGVAVGTVIALAVGFVQDRFVRRIGEDAGSQVLISLLVPFGAYLGAEDLHGSGILAAVAAGIAMNYVEIFGPRHPATRIRGSIVADILQSAGNGMMFVLLGEQLPSILSSLAISEAEAGHRSFWWLCLCIVAITVGLIVLRFLWVWLSLHFVLLRTARRGGAWRRPNWRLLMVGSLAGAKGAITLAGSLAMPLTLADGLPFPTRHLAVLLALGVVLLSLVVAAVGLPPLLHGVQLPPQPGRQRERDSAQLAADRAAVQAIHQAQHEMAQGSRDAELYAEAAARAVDPYKRRLDDGGLGSEAAARIRMVVNIERHLRVAGLRAARDRLFQLRRARQIDDEALSQMVREIDLAEAQYRS